MIFHFKKSDYDFELDTYGRLWVGKGSCLENPFLPLGKIPESYRYVVKEKVDYITPRDAYLFYMKYVIPNIFAFIGEHNYKLCSLATEYVCYCREGGYCHAYALEHHFKPNKNVIHNIPNKSAGKSILEKIEGRGNWRVRAQFLPTANNQR